MTRAVFFRSAREIESGRVIWGLLLANTHFERAHPLRVALADKAKRTFQLDRHHSYCGDLLVAILNGARFSDLTHESQQQLRSIRESSDRSKSFVMPKRRRSSQRRELRNGYAHRRSLV